MTAGVKALARAGLRNPASISVKVQDTNANIQTIPTTLRNHYIITTEEGKLKQLVHFLLSHKEEKVIVFFMTCADVEFYGRALEEVHELSEVPVETLHGRMVPKRRNGTFEHFVAMKNGVLCCTDVAAR